jgi:1,4-alpha-glucan branching enzyme
MGGAGPLALDRFADCLISSRRNTVVYHESHDEAGNSEHSGRTLMVAIAADKNTPTPTGELRRVAEARCRFVAGMIGASKDFTYTGFLERREDLHGQRRGEGKYLFRFYADIIRLRRRHRALSTTNIEIMNVHNADRVLAFHRWRGPEHYLIVSTLSDHGFSDGYPVSVPADAQGRWRQIFTSDATIYGGDGTASNDELLVSEGQLSVKLPARGFVVLRHTPS